MSVFYRVQPSPGSAPEVRLLFLREQILYDASTYAFVESDIMEEGTEDARHQLADIAESGNSDMASRVLDTAHMMCVEMLYPYAKDECENLEELDDRLCCRRSYYIVLTLPEEFSRTTVHLIKNLIHDYLVCMVLANWTGITKPEAERRWFDRAERVSERIQVSLSHRRRPLRRKLSPF